MTGMLRSATDAGHELLWSGLAASATYHPDELTIDVITALQREVNDELRREGYPVQQSELRGSPANPGRQAPG
ncbi:hypothetical protein [Amycolatopsis sp. NPDC051102]|uniref:hypothetical protein n=1 Tax=Amycolatopsis sp. NPDC051102 TaxID=3155163 RepID=UPI0034385222